MGLPFPVPSLFRAFEMLVLSWTSYARVSKAVDPGDFDFVLRRALRDIKFHCETLLSILFFMGTTMSNGPLISWTLASLLYSLVSYTALEAMSGDSLHTHLDSIPAGRTLLACFTKFPAITVLFTLCALALTSWQSVFTVAVLAVCVATLALVVLLRMRLHLVIARVWRDVVELLVPRVACLRARLVGRRDQGSHAGSSAAAAERGGGSTGDGDGVSGMEGLRVLTYSGCDSTASNAAPLKDSIYDGCAYGKV